MTVSPDQVLAPLHTKPDSLTDRVYDAIRDAIITQRLPPGARVSEARLADQLEVSKTPVREALLRLAHIGLIESDGRRGGRVPLPSPENLRSAYDYREGLEAQSARLAAERRKETDRVEIERLAQDCLARARRGDIDGFRSLDREFHRQVSVSAHSDFLMRQANDAYDLTWTLRLRDAASAEHAATCAEQHVEIAAAIASQDAAAADAFMRAHISTVRNEVLQAFDSREPRT